MLFPGADAGFTKRKGARTPSPEPQRRQPCRPMWQGGGGDASIGPRALETHGTPLYMAIIALPVIRVSFGLKMKKTGQPAKPAYMFHR